MPRFVLDAVIDHAEQFGLGDCDVLCRTPKGTLLRRDYYNREIWKPAITAAGLPADTTFHDLRHGFASTALAEGVPISEVSRWLGHKSITTTVDLWQLDVTASLFVADGRLVRFRTDGVSGPPALASSLRVFDLDGGHDRIHGPGLPLAASQVNPDTTADR